MNQKYVYGTEENKMFLKLLGLELLDFGRRFPSPGGGSYYLGDDGRPWKERPRETWITCRMVHVYSIGSLLGDTKAKELAAQGLAGLQGELRDKENGGWYAGIKADGSPLPLKQCYAHAFVMLAASSACLAKLPGAEALLEEALQVYDRYFWNEEEGLAADTWDTAFTELDPYRGINANMHSVEAFLAVADATGREMYRARAGRIIRHVIAWAQENQFRIPEHFTSDWEMNLQCNIEKPDDPFKPYGATPGHGIEWARLITQWALSDKTITEEEQFESVRAAEQLYRRAVSDGWNADGAPGIVYTTDWDGKPVVHDRMHWTLAEAINTSSVLFRVTGNADYMRDYSVFMEYLETKVHDKVNGSWFHQLDRDNRVMTTVWPGKSDLYHAFQSTLIPYAPANISIATAVFEERGSDTSEYLVCPGGCDLDECN